MLHTSQMGALEISNLISKSGNASNPLSPLNPQISVPFQPLDPFIIEGHFEKENQKHVRLHIGVILLSFHQRYWFNLSTLKSWPL